MNYPNKGRKQIVLLATIAAVVASVLLVAWHWPRICQAYWRHQYWTAADDSIKERALYGLWEASPPADLHHEFLHAIRHDLGRVRQAALFILSRHLSQREQIDRWVEFDTDADRLPDLFIRVYGKPRPTGYDVWLLADACGGEFRESRFWDPPVLGADK
jgi:hypothetical protein